jgi:hypothetical protein
MEQDNTPDVLKQCERKIKQLEEENRLLRLASGVFGQLAERLTSRLNSERRMTVTDRRLRPRHYPERRQRSVEFPAQTSPDQK